MEQRFNLLMNPPKILKVRTIVAALRGVGVEAISATHGEVKARMRQTLKNNLDHEYELALKVLSQN